jgi:hypothetical protein
VAEEMNESASNAGSQPDEAVPQVRPGWQILEAEPLPNPTYWPMVMALGIIFLLWGLFTTYIVTGFGLVLFVIALAGWIGDLRHGE